MNPTAAPTVEQKIEKLEQEAEQTISDNEKLIERIDEARPSFDRAIEQSNKLLDKLDRLPSSGDDSH